MKSQGRDTKVSPLRGEKVSLAFIALTVVITLVTTKIVDALGSINLVLQALVPVLVALTAAIIVLHTSIMSFTTSVVVFSQITP